MNRRYAQIMLGIFLLFVGLNSVTNGQPFGVLMGLGGFYLLARQFEESRNNRQQERRASAEQQRWEREEYNNRYDFKNVHDEVDRRPTTNAPQVYSHALEAVQAAGLDASDTPVLPVDIGIISHKGDEQPSLYRTRRVPKEIDYVQPFVQLRLPTKARGRIRFEIIDDHGEVVFRHTDQYDLKRGRNLVVPSSRLPVHDALEMEEGNWSLRIWADDVLIAHHEVDWLEPADNMVAEYLEDDGEIGTELKAAMAESRLEDLSLDDLLSYQDEPSSQSAAKRQS